ncbi:flagellin [Sansalvadorimonas verongulae]|uniref:flagellin n=1 Tax=Sansalvadorimonas verongulae TaxID=2172824 RepID=UPI0012BD1F8D|nr:flagellin [Sansalvadorimonas verongulae]MTI13255.1 flagellin [Sansalvadorimonas verongulae]
MSFSVNTNVFSLNAQRNLMTSGSGLQEAMQRLSSGSRINSAKDDAAGLQISNRLTSQIRGLGVAVRNANDGISLAQTAEGALQESTNILQRMRELALQSANGSNGADERAALQKEVSALQEELSRIADTTTFGGRKLLDGSFGTSDFQVGADRDQTISITLSSASAVDLGVQESISGFGVDFTTSFRRDNIGEATNAAPASARIDELVTFDFGSGNTTSVLIKQNSSDEEFLTAFNTALNADGLYARENSGTGAIEFYAETTTSFDVVSNADGTTGAFVSGTAATITPAGSTTVTGVTVATQSEAQNAVSSIDAALKTIDGQRADLGAVQNRLTSTISNLSNISENVSASRSRIQDADFAAETANLAKYQVLQQAGTAILAQANQTTQNVLSLLR